MLTLITPLNNITLYWAKKKTSTLLDVYMSLLMAVNPAKIGDFEKLTRIQTTKVRNGRLEWRLY
ncbi:hypothetical protein DM784_15095 [Vibrio furnissii]|nr:hypothetical protein DM784_15095 [Vibrio furnissii]